LPVKLPSAIDRGLRPFHVDFAPAAGAPTAVSVVAATIVSIAGSLAADALLVTIGQAVFPSTRGYPHFQFPDYSKLTVIGVVIACLAWPIVTRISSQPRWLFLRMAVAVTLVLWLPDVYIVVLGAPPKAVAFLFLMHLAIALVTYNCLVRFAKIRPLPAAAAPAPPAPPRRQHTGRGQHTSHRRLPTTWRARAAASSRSQPPRRCQRSPLCSG
jgi:hypothetical protein